MSVTVPVLLIALSGMSLRAEGPGTSLQEAIQAARLVAQEGISSGDMGKLQEAADMGIALLEATPEDQWDLQELQGFLKDMAYGWLSKLPKGGKEAWLDRHATNVSAPSSHLVVGFIEWKAGRRMQALGRAAHVLSAAPDSFAAGMAMMGILTIHYHRGDMKAGTTALKSFIQMGPNNPMVCWGLRCYVWAVCGRNQPQLANGLINEVLATRPDTKVGQAAGEMRQILDAIGRRDYAGAFGALEKIERSYWYEMALNDMILTFVVPAKSPQHKKQLIDAMTQLAATYPHEAARPLAQCIMGTTYRVSRQYAKAAQLFEQTFEETQGAANPLIRMAFELHLLTQLGRTYAKIDPARAIEYLEQFRAKYGRTAGAEFHHIILGRAYLQTDRADKAHEVFLWLEDWRNSGETIANGKLKGAIQSGLIASLDKLGRHAEAQALAESLLAPHGYGEPVGSLNSTKRRKLAVLLRMMGRHDEAKQYGTSR